MGERARITAGRAAARWGIGAAWGLVMFALVWGGACLGIWIFYLADAPELADVGLLAGVVLAVVVCRRSQLRIQRLRLHLMASRAITATATVYQVDRHQTHGRGPNRTIYTVWFAWTDPIGTRQLRKRQYWFFASGLREFEVRVAEGTPITVRYPAGRPDRFIADIPYSATMADQLL
jgi:hypothetical protein